MFNERHLARGLGLLSLALGAVYLAVPARFSRWIGVPPTSQRSGVVALVGVRQVGVGLGLLASRRPTRWLAMRLLGDAKDIGLLLAAMRLRRADRPRLGAALAAIGGITAVDVLATLAWRTRSEMVEGRPETALSVRRTITVRRPREEVYRFWRDFENLPSFMENLESVAVLDERRSHWTARAPGGGSVEWDAEITEDQPDQLIAWRTLAEGDVNHEGRVRFEPAPQDYGTEVHVELEYEAPGGALGATLARLTGDEPSQQVKGDLYRFKQVLETGEVVRSEAIVGNGGLKQRPAQPLDREGGGGSQ